MSDMRDVLDNLGVPGHIEEGDMITDAVVLLKIVDAHGHVRLSMRSSAGMSWIERVGILKVSLHNELTDTGEIGEDD